jgi:D-3-phosphoglycerate dehydrogenase / 2-oxoglutarate reductase
MKILVADAFSPEGIEEMKKMGHEVVYEPKKVGAEFVKAMEELKPIVLVVRSKKVTKEVIDADPKLEMVIRAGAGVDTIDVAYCSKKGIYVANCPGKNSVAVAELAMGLIVSIDRRIPENVQLLKENKWEKGMFAECIGIKGRTLGLIGIGNVGKEVAKRAIAFGMKVIACDVFLSAEDIAAMGATKIETAQEIAKQADIISLHVPALKETLKMVNKEFLALLKPDAVLINTARADLVVEEDLLERLEKVKGFWYGSDVFSAEPADKKAVYENKLAKHPKVVGTHHIGASTKEAETAIGIEAVRMVKEYGSMKKVNNCVNLATDIKTTHSMSVKYASTVGMLGSILAPFNEHKLKIEELKNEVFKDRAACVATIHFTGDVAKKEELVAAIAKIPGVLDTTFIN